MHKKLFYFLLLIGALSRYGAAAAPSVSASRTEGSITLDGRLTEPEWLAAPVATDFVQQRPVEGQPSSEKTEVRILYNSKALYIGVLCYDSEPGKIIDVQGRRDGDLTDSDSILIILDTYHDRQNGFLFGTNPSGIQYDAQILNEGLSGGQVGQASVGSTVGGTNQRGNPSSVNLNWNATWRVQSSRSDQGWQTEMEIPWKSLRFKNSDEPQSWGLNIMRNIRRKNEQSFWSPITQAFSIYRVSLAGVLNAVEIHPPINLKLIPYVLAGPQKDYVTKDKDFRSDFGFDVKYGLTSTLTLDGTINTDFAQVEVDDEQINISRFDLFFPEKRSFFLENAGMFAFGSPREVDLFFSRRIGIERGQELSILGGARLSGKLDRFNLGLLSIQTAEEEGFVSGQNFLVARVRRELQGRSNVGLIFTNRESTGAPLSSSNHNRAVGTDLQLGLGENVVVSGYLAKTYSPHLVGDDYAGHAAFNYRSDLWRFDGAYTDVGKNFNPEVGFVSRRGGYRSPQLRIAFTPSPKGGWIRQWNPHFQTRRFYGPDGKLESRRYHNDLEVFRTDGGAMAFSYDRDHEFLRVPLEIHPGVFIPAGSYDFGAFEAFYSFNPAARLFGEVTWRFGDFYGGDFKLYDFEMGFRTGPEFFVTLAYANTGVDADWGRFNTNLARLRLNYSFSPNRSLQALFQYNSRFQQFSSNIRLSLISASSTGLYVVYNDRYHTPGDQFDPLGRAFFVKYNHQVDF